jgi:hypothetical protein
VPSLPPLPGTPLSQAVALAQWAMAHDQRFISEAGFNLWDAIYLYDAAWWEGSGEECLGWADSWDWASQTNFAVQCSSWASGVSARVEALLVVIEAEDPDAGEVLAATGEGAAEQTAAARRNWQTFADSVAEDATIAGAGLGALGLALLALGGLVLLGGRR